MSTRTPSMLRVYAVWPPAAPEPTTMTSYCFLAAGEVTRPSLVESRSLVKSYPHFESPQFKQVLQPSIITTAAVLHFEHSCAPSGKCDLEKASVCLVRA